MTQHANIMKLLASKLHYSLNIGWNVVDLWAVLVCHDHGFSSSGVCPKGNPILQKTKNTALYTPSLNTFGIQLCSTLVHWKMYFKSVKDLQNIRQLLFFNIGDTFVMDRESRACCWFFWLLNVIPFPEVCLYSIIDCPSESTETKILLAGTWVEALRSEAHVGPRDMLIYRLSRSMTSKDICWS